MAQWFFTTNELQKNDPKAVDVAFLSQLLGRIISAHDIHFKHQNHQEPINNLSIFGFFFFFENSGSR